MKARFYVTVEVPTPKSQLEKVKARDAKAEVTTLIEERVNENLGDLNPTNIKVRFPRK
jgi:hypothetical protein